MAFSSATTRVRVRTTPLTCGSQASVAIRMRIGRLASCGALIASRMRGSERGALAPSGAWYATARRCSWRPPRRARHPAPEGAQQRLLGGEVAIDGPLADLGVLGDLGEGEVL